LEAEPKSAASTIIENRYLSPDFSGFLDSLAEVSGLTGPLRFLCEKMSGQEGFPAIASLIAKQNALSHGKNPHNQWDGRPLGKGHRKDNHSAEIVS
jgi:hypothetical protein